MPSKLLLAIVAFINFTWLPKTPIIRYKLSSGHGVASLPKHTKLFGLAPAYLYELSPAPFSSVEL